MKADARRSLSLLTENGAVLIRRKGTHQVWRLPSGRRVTISVSRRNPPRSHMNMLSRVRRILAEEEA